MNKMIDLRSDTVTQPTQAMREAIYTAVVGDDILGEDPTVRELEMLGAELLGKEGGLFVSSGTMANQIAVMVLAGRGEEILIGSNSHIFNLEVGGLAALSQVQTRPFNIPEGVYDLEELEFLIRDEGVQNPRTGLICLENTNDLNGGLVVPLDNIDGVCALAKKHGIPVYMDGARIFNAEVASGVPASRIVANVDAAMFALTKGIGAPFGAILAGNKDFIKEARWFKQRIGGGYRQVGFMAAAGIVGLSNMRAQIMEDHENARILGELLAGVEGLKVETSRIHTNILRVKVVSDRMGLKEFLHAMNERGVKAKPVSKDSFRMVTHYGISEEEVRQVAKITEEVLNG